MEWSGESWGCQTQSALSEGLLDLIQHIPKKRRLVTFSLNGYCLTRLGEKTKREVERDIKVTTCKIIFYHLQLVQYLAIDISIKW